MQGQSRYFVFWIAETFPIRRGSQNKKSVWLADIIKLMTKYNFLLLTKIVIKASKCCGLLQKIHLGLNQVDLAWFKSAQCWFLPGALTAKVLVPEILCNGRGHQVIMAPFLLQFVIVNIFMTVLCSQDNASKNSYALLYIINHFSNKIIFAIGNIRKKMQEGTYLSCS